MQQIPRKATEKGELAALLRNVLVRIIDENGGLELESQIEGKASVMKRVPVEAEGKDEDGAIIHMLPHVNDGRPVELELFREGAGNVKRIPRPFAFELIVLPPTPAGGWTSHP